MNEKNNEIILFETHDQEVKLSVSLENETVWLSSNQMALLFDRDEKTVRKHVNNVFKENELDKENNTQKMRVDGCKRIAASIFLEFLGRNDALFRNEEKVISDGVLVAITLMIAESKPEEKDIMTTLVMNLLKM